MAHILVVDDDEIFRDAIEKNVTAMGHKTSTAPNGKAALEAMRLARFDLIISDIRMPEMDGVALLKAMRTLGNTPVILMTGFSEILETQTAVSLGANEFIPKPFHVEDLQGAIQRCLRPPQKSGVVDKFCALSLNDFTSGRKIKFNIYVKATAEKYVKLANAGEDLTRERIRFYREKGLTHLYLRRDDFRSYIGFELSEERSTIEQGQLLIYYAQEVLKDGTFRGASDEAAHESSMAFVSGAFECLSDDKRIVTMLLALREHAEHAFRHSVSVSFLGDLMAQALEWSLPTNRFKVILGGVLADIGLTRVKADIVNRDGATWKENELREYEQHPIVGVEMLKNITEIPDDVREVVKQHHENCLSKGFPFALKRASIHPMAKLVAMVDDCCYRVVPGPQCKNMSLSEAVADMRAQIEMYDKRFLEALALMFGMGQKNSKAS